MEESIDHDHSLEWTFNRDGLTCAYDICNLRIDLWQIKNIIAILLDGNKINEYIKYLEKTNLKYTKDDKLLIQENIKNFVIWINEESKK